MSHRSTLKLVDLIAPLTLDDFLRDVWEQRLLVQREPTGGDFDALFSLEAADHLIAGTVLQPPAIGLIRSGAFLPAASFTTPGSGGRRVADAGRVFDEYHRGATVLLRAIHRSCLPVARFSRHLEELFGGPVTCCAFLSPPNVTPEHGEPRFIPHYDADEMVILQISGSKQWRIYDEPFPLPLSSGERDEVRVEAHGSFQDLTLRRGDALYLPRGYVHDVVTSDEHSLHIRFTIRVFRWIDALRAGVEALGDEIDVRRSLPLGALNDDGLDEFTAGFEQVKRLALGRMSAAAAAARLRQSFLEQHRPVLDGHLLDRMQLEDVRATTIVRRRPGTSGELAGDRQETTGPGQRRIGDNSGLDPVSAYFIRSHDTFRVADIPGPLDQGSKVALARRLIRDGVLELADRAAAAPRGAAD